MTESLISMAPIESCTNPALALAFRRNRFKQSYLGATSDHEFGR